MSPRDFGDRLFEYEYRHGTEPPTPRLTVTEKWLLGAFVAVLTLLIIIVLWSAFHGGGA